MTLSAAVIVVLIFLASMPYAQRPPVQTAYDNIRIERLAALGRVWGAIKYFHPYLGYKDIDWDKALVETIPKVNDAKSVDDYRAAVAHMLSFLKDPNTRVLGQPTARVAYSSSGPIAAQPFTLRWTEDRIAIFDGTNHDEYVEVDREKFEAFRKRFAEAASARAIVFDLRRANSNRASRNFSLALGLLLDEDLPLPAVRHRMHSSYPWEGDYRNRSTNYSGFVTADGGSFAARGTKGSQKRIAVIINARTPGIHPLLLGLQSAGKGTIVQEGDATIESGVSEYAMKLTDGLTVSVRTSELLNPNGMPGFWPEVIVPASPDASSDSSPAMAAALQAARAESLAGSKTRDAMRAGVLPRVDKPYSEPGYPSEPYRLLALFKFWNVINYFFPYKHLIDRPWDSVLAEYIPKLDAAANALEYSMTIAEFGTNIHDSHGYVISPALSQYFGTHEAQLKVARVEGQTVIVRIDDDIRRESGLSVGDVVISVDGEDIAKTRERLGRIMSASTPTSLEWRFSASLLSGAENSEMKLVAKNRDGKLIEATMKRTRPPVPFERSGPISKVLPSGYGYIDLARLTIPEADAAFEAIKGTPAVIFDMRGYPRGTHDAVASRLTDKQVVTALFHQNMTDNPDPDYSTRLSFRQILEPSEKWRYTGKVVVLINEIAISAAEHMCLYLEAATHVTFIGSHTNGANGSVTQVVLPGGISVNFSGQDVRHADGRQLQRIGIRPDVIVEPTIEGIRNGRDEVLEEAIAFLKKGNRP